MNEFDMSLADSQVDRALAVLAEHFDAVQVMASALVDGGNTVTFYRGFGNWHARQGMAREFTESDAAQISARAHWLAGGGEEEDGGHE